MYYLSLKILDMYELLRTHAYQLQTIDVGDAPARILQVIYNSFLILISSQEFIPIYVRYALLFILIIAFVNIIIKPFHSNLSLLSKWIHSIVFALLFILSVFMTKALFIISAYNGFHAFRMQGGLIFLYAFSFGIVLLAKLPLIRSISLVIATFCILAFIQSDLAYQALEVEQQKHAYAIGFELAKKVQTIKKFNPKKNYRYIQLGNFPLVKRTMYTNNMLYNKKPDLGAGDQIFGCIQLAAKGSLLKHFMPNIKLNYTRVGDIYKLNKNLLWEILTYSKNHLPWPAEGSVAILHNNVIFVYVNPGLLPNIKKAINRR